MKLSNRVSKLEATNLAPVKIPDIEIIIIDNKEQVDHPERFTKVLESEDSRRKLYRLEPKNN